MVLIKRLEKYSIFRKVKDEKDEALLVAATVIAAMAYQAAISPPGGIAGMDAAAKAPVSSVNTYELKPSRSLLAYFDSNLSDLFWVFNTISLLSSLSVIFLYVSGFSLKRQFQIWLIRGIMWITVTSMAVAYVCAVRATIPNTQNGARKALNIGIIAWGTMLIVTNWIWIFNNWTRDDQVEVAAPHTDNNVI